ncbi:MAG: hypothetical protein DSM106950_28465 [Stigonema ocellatum SAG 48.90 = DSM 106950]|nr:hypothetical protein [Stigonema ocellatum SAG 48.90 = DSM 106950]
MATPSTSASALTPSQAATFASSQGELNFTNFSLPFSIVEKQNQGDTSPTAKGGNVEAQNLHAIVNVQEKPASASTSALSQAFGNSKFYSGTAKTQSKIIANFNVEPGKLFSFDFSATVDLQTRINEQKFEKSRASGEISFKLFDTTDIPKENLPSFLAALLSDDTNHSIKKSPLDFFSLTGNLNTPGNNDSIAKEKSHNVTITSEDKKFNIGGTQESAKYPVKGSFKHSFDKRTNLTLIALRKTEATVISSQRPNA